MFRFDLICLVLDRPDESSDIQLARHIASLHVTDENDAHSVNSTSSSSAKPRPLVCIIFSLMSIGYPNNGKVYFICKKAYSPGSFR